MPAKPTQLIALALVATIALSLLPGLQAERRETQRVATAGATPVAVKPAVTVNPARQMSQRIDQLLQASWREADVGAAKPATDQVFVRRAYLDLTGVIPTVGEVRSFLRDTRPDKRARLVEHLLDHPQHATHLANQWQGVLLPNPQNFNNIFYSGQGLKLWLRDHFADNVAYNKIVFELLAADPQAASRGPLQYYTFLQMQPETLADSVARTFMGEQFGCAECHDHPFTHWTQDDFWSFAAYFRGLQQENIRENNNTTSRLVLKEVDADLKIPGSDDVVQPRLPVELESVSQSTAEPTAGETRRARVARWLTARDNPYFARATVNRLWWLLFGRGLVEPIDAISTGSGEHQQLLDELAAWFVEQDYDVRRLLQALATTKAYGLASTSATADFPQQQMFARMAIKTLTARQLYACLRRAVGPAASTTQLNQVVFLGAGFNQNEQLFVTKFSAPGASATEYHAGIPQALALINGTLTAAATDLKTSRLLMSLDAPFFTDPQRLEILFLSTLSRLPHDDEREQFVQYIEKGGATGQPREALADVLWALLNSAEFAMNH